MLSTTWAKFFHRDFICASLSGKLRLENQWAGDMISFTGTLFDAVDVFRQMMSARQIFTDFAPRSQVRGQLVRSCRSRRPRRSTAGHVLGDFYWSQLALVSRRSRLARGWLVDDAR